MVFCLYFIFTLAVLLWFSGGERVFRLTGEHTRGIGSIPCLLIGNMNSWRPSGFSLIDFFLFPIDDLKIGVLGIFMV